MTRATLERGSTPRRREVIIRYRWEGAGPPPGPGDVLRTRGGSCYRVIAARRAPGAERWRLRCVRLDRDAFPAEAPGVFPLVWDSTGRRGSPRGGRRVGQPASGGRG